GCAEEPPPSIPSGHTAEAEPPLAQDASSAVSAAATHAGVAARSGTAAASTLATEPRAPAAPTELCPRPALVFDGGRHRGHVCTDEAYARGLTVIDLSDDWAPFIFTEDPSLGEAGKQPYLPIYLALASERFGEGPRWERARE